MVFSTINIYKPSILIHLNGFLIHFSTINHPFWSILRGSHIFGNPQSWRFLRTSSAPRLDSSSSTFDPRIMAEEARCGFATGRRLMMIIGLPWGPVYICICIYIYICIYIVTKNKHIDIIYYYNIYIYTWIFITINIIYYNICTSIRTCVHIDVNILTDW